MKWLLQICLLNLCLILSGSTSSTFCVTTSSGEQVEVIEENNDNLIQMDLVVCPSCSRKFIAMADHKFCAYCGLSLNPEFPENHKKQLTEDSFNVIISKISVFSKTPIAGYTISANMLRCLDKIKPDSRIKSAWAAVYAKSGNADRARELLKEAETLHADSKKEPIHLTLAKNLYRSIYYPGFQSQKQYQSLKNLPKNHELYELPETTYSLENLTDNDLLKHKVEINDVSFQIWVNSDKGFSTAYFFLSNLLLYSKNIEKTEISADQLRAELVLWLNQNRELALKELNALANDPDFMCLDKNCPRFSKLVNIPEYK